MCQIKTRGVKIYQEVILQLRSRRLHHSRLEGVDPSRLTVLPKNTSQLVQDDQRSINPCPHHPSYGILLYHISSDYHRTLDLSSREPDDVLAPSVAMCQFVAEVDGDADNHILRKAGNGTALSLLLHRKLVPNWRRYMSKAMLRD